MEEELKEDVNSGTNNESEGTQKQEEVKQEEKKEITFNEWLASNKEYQAEHDRKVQEAIKTAQSNWEEKQNEDLSEAERFAKMTKEEQLEYQLKKEREKNMKMQKQVDAKDLKDEAIRIATAPDTAFDIRFLELINFENETADTLNEKTKLIKTIFDKAVEDAINEYSKEKAPKNVNPLETSKTYTLTEIGDMVREQKISPEKAKELIKNRKE